MNMNLVTLEREVYNLLDFFGDVGGLQAAIFLIFGGFYSLCTVNAFENWLVQSLFRADKIEDQQFNDAYK